MFWFFLSSYRSGILDFCGSNVNVTYDENGDEGKYIFRCFENGDYKLTDPITRHPNIVKGVIIGKKSWGLWCDQWSQGIVEWTFTEEEILNEFKIKNIEIPEPLLLEFQKLIDKKKNKRNEEYLKKITSSVHKL